MGLAPILRRCHSHLCRGPDLGIKVRPGDRLCPHERQTSSPGCGHGSPKPQVFRGPEGGWEVKSWVLRLYSDCTPSPDPA